MVFLKIAYFEQRDAIVLVSDGKTEAELEEEYGMTVTETFDCEVERDYTGLPTDRMLMQEGPGLR